MGGPQLGVRLRVTSVRLSRACAV